MKPPYYAVIFTSKRKSYGDDYEETAERMKELTMQQPGFLGIDSARNADGLGITVCYWDSIEAIKSWKAIMSINMLSEWEKKAGMNRIPFASQQLTKNIQWRHYDSKF